MTSCSTCCGYENCNRFNLRPRRGLSTGGPHNLFGHRLLVYFICSGIFAAKYMQYMHKYIFWLRSGSQTANSKSFEIAQHRPLALRGHVTNASLNDELESYLCQKIDRAHKNLYLTPEIWEETHLTEIIYGTLIFQQNSMISIGRHVGGRTLALLHGGQNYFLLLSC